MTEPLTFPVADAPRVTVVIPVHNRWEFTERCLASILRYPITTPYCVLIVDDASTDETASKLATAVTGIDVLSLDENEGYLRASNHAFKQVHTEFTALLNNDTEVLEGWLDELVATASEFGVGAVGSKLIHPCGTLQEAGSVIWADATGWNLGRGGDPLDPAHNVRSSVDYCSAASLLVRTDLLHELGGFDERFVPAYYEDVDLQFSIRGLGYAVVYQPRSAVIHHEGISHGTDPLAGVKQHQEPNRLTFVDKWAAVLASHPRYSERALVESRWRRTRGVVLVIDEWVPRWDRDAGSRRMLGVLALLQSAGFAVVFIPHNRAAAEPYTSQLQAMGVFVLAGSFEIGRELESIRPSVVAAFISRPDVAEIWLPVVRKRIPSCKIIFDTVDLHHLREVRRAAVTGSADAARAAEAMRALEFRLARAADVTTVVSAHERAVLAESLPDASVELLPLVYQPIDGIGGPADRSGVVFVGSFQHPPNEDAMLWFLGEVWPLVLARLPQAVLDIVGAGPTERVRSAVERSANVRLLGWVRDLDALYASSRAAIAPLRFGAGQKGKVAEAMALGVPVVVTSVAAEGMELGDAGASLVADTASDFAGRLVEVLTDDDLWEAASGHGLLVADRMFGFASSAAHVERLVADVGRPPASSSTPVSHILGRMQTVTGPPPHRDPTSSGYLGADRRPSPARRFVNRSAYRLRAALVSSTRTRRTLLPYGSWRDRWARRAFQSVVWGREDR